MVLSIVPSWSSANQIRPSRTFSLMGKTNTGGREHIVLTYAGYIVSLYSLLQRVLEFRNKPRISVRNVLKYIKWNPAIMTTFHSSIRYLRKQILESRFHIKHDFPQSEKKQQHLIYLSSMIKFRLQINWIKFKTINDTGAFLCKECIDLHQLINYILSNSCSSI